MAYVPQFESDIFVSYRHASNEGRDKWVDALCQGLQARLKEIVGDVTMWQDKAGLRAGDMWRPEIAKAIDGAAIFLAIISRTYFDSEVCTNELDAALGRIKDATEAAGRRIVPIFKQPIKPEQELPQELAERDQHRFFQQDPPPSNRFREFSPEQAAGPFWETLEQLAQDLMFALDELKGKARQRAVGSVYLARVAPELHAERAKLRADLQQRGYAVLPEREYLWNATDFHERIAADLDAAELCVHQVARTASLDPNAAERAKLQLKLATAAMKNRGRAAPIVWIQPGTETDPAAAGLIDFIERELSNEGVEYWQGSLEDFKTQIYDKLPKRAPAAPEAAATDVPVLVEERDLEATEPLMALVEKLSLAPVRVKFSASIPKDPSHLAKTIARSSRLVVFWGAQSEDWVNDVLALEPLAAFAGKQRLCVFSASPDSAEKRTFRTGKARMVRETSGTSETELREFLGVME